MKPSISIFTAAAAVVAGLVRQVIAMPMFNADEQATTIPRITPKQVERLAYGGATDEEIADRFLVDAALLREQYADVLRASRAVRQMTMRTLQLELAKKLNGPMLIWLGKNELGQSNNPTAPGEPEPEVIDD